MRTRRALSCGSIMLRAEASASPMSTGLSASSPLASTQGCVLDAAIQLTVQESGAAVMVPHVRGSSGYGARYAGLAKQHRREAAVKDVRSLLSWLAQRTLPSAATGGTRRPSLEYDTSRVSLYGVGVGACLAASVSATLCELADGAPLVPRCVVLERPVTNLVTFLGETARYLQPILRNEFGCVSGPLAVEAASLFEIGCWLQR